MVGVRDWAFIASEEVVVITIRPTGIMPFGRNAEELSWFILKLPCLVHTAAIDGSRLLAELLSNVVSIPTTPKRPKG